jgi:hypothetical protein
LEIQRQQLLQERQQFHLEQLRAAEFRQRQLAAQQLMTEGKLTIPTIVNNQTPLVSTAAAAAAPSVQQQQAQQSSSIPTPAPTIVVAPVATTAAPTVASPAPQTVVMVAQPQHLQQARPPSAQPAPAVVVEQPPPPPPQQQQQQQPPSSQTPTPIGQQQPQSQPQPQVVQPIQITATAVPIQQQQQQPNQGQASPSSSMMVSTAGQPSSNQTPSNENLNNGKLFFNKNYRISIIEVTFTLFSLSLFPQINKSTNLIKVLTQNCFVFSISLYLPFFLSIYLSFTIYIKTYTKIFFYFLSFCSCFGIVSVLAVNAHMFLLDSLPTDDAFLLCYLKSAPP